MSSLHLFFLSSFAFFFFFFQSSFFFLFVFYGISLAFTFSCLLLFFRSCLQQSQKILPLKEALSCGFALLIVFASVNSLKAILCGFFLL